jgi:hypothetical protein
MLPVADLRLDSYVYKQQPTLSRSSYSHVDNEGVKALVDGICSRWGAHGGGQCSPSRKCRPPSGCPALSPAAPSQLQSAHPTPSPLQLAHSPHLRAWLSRPCAEAFVPAPAPSSDMVPMKLSLCGATALTHDAVSALLRLPLLSELDIGGCCRITAMDKMRLVAKVGRLAVVECVVPSMCAFRTVAPSRTVRGVVLGGRVGLGCVRKAGSGWRGRARVWGTGTRSTPVWRRG